MKTTIRLPDDVAERLKKAAEGDRRSVHAQMLVYIERGLYLAEAGIWNAGWERYMKKAADAKDPDWQDERA